MSTRFLLPCPHCDHKIELLPVQAGQEMVCENCKQPIEAPKLGALKRLPTVGESKGEKQPANSALKRGLFAAGLSLAMLLGLAGTALYFYASSMIFDLQLEEQIRMIDDETKQLAASQLLNHWTEMQVELGLGEWVEQPVARYRTQGRHLQNVAYGMWAIAGVGGLMMLISFVLPKR